MLINKAYNMRSIVCTCLVLLILLPAAEADKTFRPFISDVNRSDIEKYIEKLLQHPRAVEALITRSYQYFPLIEEQLDNACLPQELKFLAVIESSLEPRARSEVGAVGLWQLMPGTARDLGLRVSQSYDERKDPLKASVAAMEYLNGLYQFYGDWTLCIAAYNTGPGNVNKAIRKADSYNFNKLKAFLPRQTQNHITKFAAVQQLLSNYEMYGLIGRKPSLDKLLVGTISIDRRIGMKKWASSNDVDLELLKELNPAIDGISIPSGYEVRVPLRVMKKNIKSQEPYCWYSIEVPVAMSLAQFAKMYQVSPYLLKHVNDLKHTALFAHQILSVPYFNVMDADFLEQEELDPSIYHEQECPTYVESVEALTTWNTFFDGKTMRHD